MNLEDRIAQIREDMASQRYTTAAKESGAIVEFAFREIYRRSIGLVDDRTRMKALAAESKIGGPGKGIGAFTLGQLYSLFRESDLLVAYGQSMSTQLRAIKMINFDELIRLRNRMQHELYEADRLEAQLFLHCVETMLETFGILTLNADSQVAVEGAQTVSSPSSVPPPPKREASTYRASGTQELERLILQGSFQRPLDLRMFEYALDGLESSVLGVDVGCADGEVTRDRFERFPQFEHVIGIDKDSECIAAASAVSDGQRWNFQVLDIENADAEEKFRQLVLRQDEESPVVVFMAFLLNHVAAPIRVLRILRSALPKGSKVVIRSGDDFFTHEYPDHAGRLKFILGMSEKAPRAADRRHGRKLYGQLYRAGYRRIRMFADPILSPNLSETERRSLYKIWFDHRLAPWERALENGNQVSVEDLQALREALVEYELDMEDPAFFFLAVGLGAVAEVS
ncbi:MAG: class I SAM-dependent methyltransferase [Myxococcales bacterium]|nr:class I SAM-dependent methyltransferase [Myxococcales bacterium]